MNPMQSWEAQELCRLPIRKMLIPRNLHRWASPHTSHGKFQGFSDLQVLEANRIAFYPSPKGPLLISHPYAMSEWFRQGKIMLPGDKQFDFN